jgi:hypothetical protein
MLQHETGALSIPELPEGPSNTLETLGTENSYVYPAEKVVSASAPHLQAFRQGSSPGRFQLDDKVGPFRKAVVLILSRQPKNM